MCSSDRWQYPCVRIKDRKRRARSSRGREDHAFLRNLMSSSEAPYRIQAVDRVLSSDLVVVRGCRIRLSVFVAVQRFEGLGQR